MAEDLFGWFLDGALASAIMVLACVAWRFYKIVQATRDTDPIVNDFTFNTSPGVAAYRIPPEEIAFVFHVHLSNVRLLRSGIDTVTLSSMYNWKARPGFFTVTADHYLYLHPTPDGVYPVVVQGGPTVVYSYADGNAVQQQEKHDRSIDLMLDWLSPAQLRSLVKNKYFIAIGSDSKKKYRINPGQIFNVHELNADGKLMARLCFVPYDAPYLGDIMLAQKMTLEKNEAEALKVANRQLADTYTMTSSTPEFADMIEKRWAVKKATRKQKRKASVDKKTALP